MIITLNVCHYWFGKTVRRICRFFFIWVKLFYYKRVVIVQGWPVLIRIQLNINIDVQVRIHNYCRITVFLGCLTFKKQAFNYNNNFKKWIFRKIISSVVLKKCFRERIGNATPPIKNNFQTIETVNVLNSQ